MTHPLKKYLKAAELTEEAFADKVDTTASYISQIICGHRFPSRDLAKQIETASEGLVKAADLLTWQPN